MQTDYAKLKNHLQRIKNRIVMVVTNTSLIIHNFGLRGKKVWTKASIKLYIVFGFLGHRVGVQVFCFFLIANQK